MKTALLLSGGMDSSALLWWKRPDYAVTINYGQLAANAEINASSLLCKDLGIEHIVIDIDCSSLGSGDMSQGNEKNKYAQTSDWWPYRNQLLITLAAMKFVGLDVKKLYIGTVCSDESHLDGTMGFVERINSLLQYQEGNIEIEAPAIGMSTVDLIKTSKIPESVLALSHSCHKANVPCGFCRGCNKFFQVYGAINE